MKRMFLFGLVVFISLIFVQNLSASDNYHFAILGDRTGGANQEAFEMVLRDIERLHPDFMITVGDQIEGYTDRETAEKEWDEILKCMKVVTFPVFYTAGNHDIYCEESEKVFSEKTGFKSYYTFDYENSHFVILNNSTAENFEQMGKEQIEWLKCDLRTNRDKENIFVFMHKPFWAHGIAEGNEDAMHTLFKENNVDVVFTGHWHQYASNEYDGVKYILVGSSGGDYGPKENIGLGMFYQFMWCKVDGDKLYASIIKAGNIYDDDLVTIEEEQMSYEISHNLITSEAELFEGERKKSMDVSVRIINKTKKKIENEINWNSKMNWKVSPESRPTEIAPNDTLHSTFQLIQKGGFYPLPTISFVYPFGRDKRYEYEKPVFVHKKINSERVEKAPVIDGKLGKKEWTSTVTVSNFGNFDGNKAKIDETEVYFSHDSENLYIGARCGEDEIDKLKAELTNRDDPVYQDDCIGFLISPHGNYVYHIYVNTIGTIWDKKVDLEDGKQDESWNANCEVKCSKNEDSWVMEMKVPLTDIGITDKTCEISMNIRRKQYRNRESGVWMIDWVYDPSRYGTVILR